MINDLGIMISLLGSAFVLSLWLNSRLSDILFEIKRTRDDIAYQSRLLGHFDDDDKTRSKRKGFPQ
jgi:hypothetical protein